MSRSPRAPVASPISGAAVEWARTTFAEPALAGAFAWVGRENQAQPAVEGDPVQRHVVPGGRSTPGILWCFLWMLVLATGCADTPGLLEVDTTSLSFATPVGQEEQRSFVIQNPSDAPVKVERIQFEETPAALPGPQFTVNLAAEGATVEAGGSLELVVTFHPTQVGAVIADIVVTGERNTLELSAVGEGQNNLPVVTLDVPDAACVGVPVGLSAWVDDVEDAANTLSVRVLDESGQELAAGNPLATGVYSTSVTLTAPGERLLEVEVTDAHQGIGTATAQLTVGGADVNQDGVPDCQDQDRDGVSPSQGDCDDTNATIYPGATDVCSGKDENCDGELDELPLCDADGDGTSDWVDDDGDGITERQRDCKDLDATIYPGAQEVCDGIDQDCDTRADDGFDSDGDGHLEEVACASQGGDDCNDADALIVPGIQERCDGVDEDCDDVIDEGFDVDGDGITTCAGDCNDSSATIYLGAGEVCDGIDQDCDGQQDEDFDVDGDGALSLETCPSRGTDCDDVSSSIKPGQAESCDGIDQDCDGLVDEDFDADGDGTLSEGRCPGRGDDCDDTQASTYPGAVERCNQVDDDCDDLTDEDFDLDQDGALSLATCPSQGTDCDDSQAAVKPGQLEQCNDVDDNCNGEVDEGEDDDRDGYLDAELCAQGDDCDDTDGQVNPAAAEVCDTLDNDCDGVTDDTDWDGDGASPAACQPTGPADCNDFLASVKPGGTETCNLRDDDCDGQIDEDFDLDGDGVSWCAGDCADNDPLLVPSVNSSGWIEYLCNPVLGNSSNSSEDSLYTDQASVLLEGIGEGRIYKAWYRHGSSASTQIAYAESPDGITWEKKGVVLSFGSSGAFDEMRLGYPTVLRKDGLYHLWYFGYSAQNKFAIGYATSPDGLLWTRQNAGTAVLAPSTDSTAWDANLVQSPTVVWVPALGRFQMYYGGAARDSNGTSVNFQIGLATSTDGLSWSRQGVVLPLGGTGEWDGSRINFGRVVYNGSFFELLYSGSAGNLPFGIGYASSVDGSAFQKYGAPVLEAGGAEWSQSLAYSPSTLRTVDDQGRSVYQMFFSGALTSGTSHYQTGLASNYQPEVYLFAPEDGSTFTTRDNVAFQVYIEDPFDRESIDVTVASDLDGGLGTQNPSQGGYVTVLHQLSPGTHRISVVAEDLGGLRNVDQITVYVQE